MALLGDMVRAGAGTFLQTAGRFVGMTLIARALGVADFGVIAFAVFSVELLVVTCLLGLPGVMTRFLPLAVEAGAEAHGRFRRLCLGWTLGAVAVTLLAAPLLGHFAVGLTMGTLGLYTLWAVAAILSAVGVAAMRGTLRFDLVVWASGLSGLVFVAGAALVVETGGPPWAMAVIALATAVLGAPGLWARPRVQVHDGGGALASHYRMLLFATNIWMTAITTLMIWSRGEMLILRVWLDDAALGLYGAAVTVSALVWQGVGLLQGAVAPHLSRRVAEGDPVRLAAFVRGMSRLTIAVAGTAAVWLAFFGTELVVLVFGEAFREAGPLVSLIAPAAAMAGVGTANLTVQFLSEGRFTRDLQIAGAILLLGLAAILLARVGLPGAAVARSVTLALVALALPLWLWVRGRRALGQAVLGDLAVALGAVAGALAIQIWVVPPVSIRLCLAILSLYGAGVAISGRLDPRHMIPFAAERIRGL